MREINIAFKKAIPRPFPVVVDPVAMTNQHMGPAANLLLNRLENQVEAAVIDRFERKIPVKNCRHRDSDYIVLKRRYICNSKIKN